MKIENKINQFLDTVVDKKILKLYLDKKNIKKLHITTLVPFSLILGKKYFKMSIKHDLSLDKKNKKSYSLKSIDKLIKDKHPLIEDESFDEYLKLFGFNNNNLTPNTLLPLGVLMSIHALYLQNFEEYYKIRQNGGSSFNALKNKLKSIIDNRVFDIYLKFLAITSLSSSTLVPLALIFGTKAFKYYITDDIKENKSFFQYGGVKIPKKIPFLDDKLLGSYLKIVGLSAMDLTMNTLIPLYLHAHPPRHTVT